MTTDEKKEQKQKKQMVNRKIGFDIGSACKMIDMVYDYILKTGIDIELVKQTGLILHQWKQGGAVSINVDGNKYSVEEYETKAKILFLLITVAKGEKIDESEGEEEKEGERASSDPDAHR